MIWILKESKFSGLPITSNSHIYQTTGKKCCLSAGSFKESLLQVDTAEIDAVLESVISSSKE